MGRISGYLLAPALVLSFCSTAHAYTPTVTPGGVPVRWKTGGRLPLAGNPSNRSGLSEATFRDSVVRSLQRWKAAAAGGFNFDYWQGTDRAKYEPNSEYNGLSSVYFASEAGASLSPNVLGVTQVWYSTDTGEIIESDIVLNDVDYAFTNNPRDTTGYGTEGGSDGRSVFIENVLTHELGHAFGFSHSGGLQSTMLFMESPEQAHLGCDEQVGARALYPVDGAARGTINGTVVAEATGQPLFGAHVVAVSRRRGVSLASALTNKSGQYSLGGLEPGAYFLMVEPFYAGSSALPAYYSGINSRVCAGDTFARTILTEEHDSDQPRALTVSGGGTTTAPTMAAVCRGGGGAAVSAMGMSAARSTAPVVHSGTSGGFGVTDRFETASTLYFKLSGVSGQVELHALGYSLYSPVHPSVTLLNARGGAVATERAEYIYEGDSGYVNYDSALVARNLPYGDYVVRVSATGLNAGLYPAGPMALDSAPFMMLTGSVNEAPPPLAATLPYNGRCRMDENFGAYASPVGDPYRHNPDAGDDGNDGLFGFCGTVSAATAAGIAKMKDGSGGSGPSGPSAGGIVGWFLPWLLMGATIRLFRAGPRGRLQTAGMALQ